MASRMEFYVVRGLPLGEVSRIFANLDDDEVPSPSDLGAHNLGLQPSTQYRSRGANQQCIEAGVSRLSEPEAPLFPYVDQRRAMIRSCSCGSASRCAWAAARARL